MKLEEMIKTIELSSPRYQHYIKTKGIDVKNENVIEEKVVNDKSICPYCERTVDYVPHFKNPEKMIYSCEDCGAYISEDKNGKPMGTLANKELRGIRFKISKYLKELPKEERMKRYKEFSSALNVDKYNNNIITNEEGRYILGLIYNS